MSDRSRSSTRAGSSRSRRPIELYEQPRDPRSSPVSSARPTCSTGEVARRAARRARGPSASARRRSICTTAATRSRPVTARSTGEVRRGRLPRLGHPLGRRGRRTAVTPHRACSRTARARSTTRSGAWRARRPHLAARAHRPTLDAGGPGQLARTTQRSEDEARASSRCRALTVAALGCGRRGARRRAARPAVTASDSGVDGGGEGGGFTPPDVADGRGARRQRGRGQHPRLARLRRGRQQRPQSTG